MYTLCPIILAILDINYGKRIYIHKNVLIKVEQCVTIIVLRCFGKLNLNSVARNSRVVSCKEKTKNDGCESCCE